MTLFSRLPLVSPLALLCISAIATANEGPYQTIQLGVQYGQGPWNFILGYQQGDANDSDDNGERRYNLEFESQSYSAFLEYYFESVWLALGYASGEDKTTYNIEDLNRNNVPEAQHLNQVNYDSLTLESGYSYYTESGQVNTSLGLTKQEVDEFTSRTNFVSGNGDLQVKENSILSSFALSYSHFFAVTDSWQLALNLGLRREITLSGESRIPRSGRFQENSSDLQAASTSQQGQISLQHSRGSLSLSVNKYSDQSFSDAYFSAGVSLNF